MARGGLSVRDANRISSIANKIEVIWRKTNPNLRFWQFLEVLVCRYNADHSLTDRKTMNEMFYVEDEDFEKILEYPK